MSVLSESPARRRPADLALAPVVAAVAWIIPTVYADASPDWLRYTLLAFGLLAFLFGEAGARVLRVNREEKERRAQLGRQSVYDNKLRSAMVRTTVLAERALTTGPAESIKATKEDLLRLVVHYSADLIGDRCSSIGFFELDQSGPDRKLRLRACIPAGGPELLRPPVLEEGAGWTDTLFAIIDQRTHFSTTNSGPNTPMSFWNSSGTEFGGLIATSAFNGTTNHGVLIACSVRPRTFTEIDLALLRVLAGQLANGLSA